jgi:hypothetical protein
VRRVLVLFGLALALAACGGNATTPTAGSGSGTPHPRTTGGAVVGSPEPGSTRPSSPGPAAPSTPGAGPSPVSLPWTPSPDVPVDAQLSPVCVRPGGVVTITVRTRPQGGIGYIALYSDNGSGAPSPYGSGYGGNDRGLADMQGRYSSLWTVAPNAPPGPARVDVIVGWNQAWGYDGPTFAVAGSDGSC